MNDIKKELPIECGNRLQQARNNAGLSLRALAEQTGGEIKQSAIGNWEQGTRMLPVYSARKLAPLLGVKGAYLLGFDDNNEITLDAMGKHSAELFQLLVKVSRKSDAEVLVVSAMLKGYLESSKKL